jgi:hypothetical protein
MIQQNFGTNPEDRINRKSLPGPIPLSYHGAYRCPVCRYGELSNLAMMDAFGCNFCSRIFTANLDQNAISLADSLPPITWHWNGRQWQGLPRAGVEFGWEIGIAAIAIITLPTLLVGLGAYIFPPIPGSSLSWVPAFWTVATFFGHLTIVLWLMVEYYQFPVLLFLKAWQRRLWMG